MDRQAKRETISQNETDRQTKRDIYTDTNGQLYRKKWTVIQTEMDRQTERETNRQKERKRQINR